MAALNGAGNSNILILNSQGNYLNFFLLICFIINQSTTPHIQGELAVCIQ